jgi:hypothetical protein
VSGVNSNITWLNVRLGHGLAGRFTDGRRHARRHPRQGWAPRARSRRCPPEASSAPYSYGGSGELFFSKEQLDQIMAACG